MSSNGNVSLQLSVLQNEARSNVKGLLAKSNSFAQLSTPEQLATYKDLVDAEYNRLVDKKGLRQFSTQKADEAAPFDPVKNRADKMIGIKDIGESFGSMVQQIDFPKFVKDLVGAVYEANIKLSKEQIETFSKMLKEVTGSLQKFITKIDDTASFAYLVENEPNRFAMIQENDPQTGRPRPILIDRETMQQMNEDDDEFKSKIMDAKIKMAQEQRALLRETILMGITRLVITNGKIKARCNFKVEVNDRLTGSNAYNKEHEENLNIGIDASAGWLWGSADMSMDYENKTKITVNTTSNIDSSQVGQAELMGEVEINFKSDYFKLENFKDMYPGIPQPPALPGAAPAATPPAAAPAAR